MSTPIVDMLLAATNERMLIDVSRHVSDRVHEIVKMHAMTMPDTRLAVALGLSVAATIAAETVEFAMNSMDGDRDDEVAIRAGVVDVMQNLLHDLMEVEPSRPASAN